MKIKILNKKISLVLRLVIIFASLVVINLISHAFFGFIRLDLTSNKIFTLSNGSKQILAKIDEPITLKLFFSKQLARENPFFVNFASRVEEFLKLYQKSSNNKIILQFIDPAPFTEEEDQAVHYGLQGVPINNEGAEMYFGLVGVNATIGKEVIPFLQPSREGYLEYDISQLIAKLSKQALNKIGVISSLPIDGNNPILSNARSWLIWQQMQQQFTVNMLDEKISEIPVDIKVLFLINTGEELSIKVAKAIDKFVLGGGHLLVMVDPHSEIKNSSKFSGLKANSEDKSNQAQATIAVDKLLAAWGVSYNQDKIVGSRVFAKQVRYTYQGKETTGLYPLWIDVDPSSLNKQDIATSGITKLTFASAGAISAVSNASSKFSPLVTIKSDPMLVDKQDFARYKADPSSLLKEYKPQSEPVNIAARITGKVGSAFSTATTENSNIIVIANVDFIYDHFWANVQNFLGNQIFVPTSGNATFILNVLDNLTGSDELISIRSKDAYIKGFDRIKELELRSQNRFQQAEAALLQRIEETKKKIGAMDQTALSLEHKQAEETFRRDLVETRKNLREVRKSLREDIQVLENNIKFFTIVLMPLLIVLTCVTYWLFGNRILTVIGIKNYEKDFK